MPNTIPAKNTGTKIKCADSPVPANEIVGLLPGELLVHRNVLNIVVHTDLNASPFCSTLSRCCGCATSSFCGHYGCGGVRAALQGARLGLIDNWLRHVRAAVRVCETTILQRAWSEGHPVSVHGWIYTLDDGRPRDLGSCVLDAEQVEAERVEAVARVAHART
jgi:carbonic anhydrase